MATHKLAILVEAIGTAEANRKLKGVDATVSKIGSRAGKGIRTAGHNLIRLGTIAAGVTAAGLVASVKAAGDFEAQLHTINTVAAVSAGELDAIGASIRKVARDTGTPLEDLTQGYYDLVSAGIKAKDATQVLTAANTLAIGGLGTTAETIDLLTTAINSYGGDASKAGQITDMFAEAIAAGKVTASELAGSFATIGPIAAQSGIGIDELSAGYARLTAAGVPASEAATQMRSALVGLTRVNAPLAKLQKQTGHNYLSIAGKKGLVAALQMLRTDADKAGVPLIKLLGRVEGVNFAMLTTGDSFDAYNAELEKVRTSTGLAAKQMAERQQGLNYELGRLKALAVDAAIVIGSKLLPKLTPLAEKAVKFLETHQVDISKFGDSIAAGFDKALQFAEKIPWDAIGGGLKTAADWAGKLMDVFMGLPRDVQTTIIALAGLNKLSGGAIGGIVGELGKGLIKGVLGINAGVVNVRGGVVNGVGGAGTAGAVGAGGGTLGSLLKVLGVVSLADLASQFSPAITQTGIDLHDALGLPKINLNDLQWPFGPKNTPTILPDVFGGNGLLGGTPAGPTTTQPVLDPVAKNAVVNSERTLDHLADLSSRSYSADAHESAVIASKLTTINTSTRVGDSSIRETIRANRPIVHVNVGVRVSGDTVRVTKNYTSGSKIGKPGGPRTGGQQEF